jgi:hypothetical protein
MLKRGTIDFILLKKINTYLLEFDSNFSKFSFQFDLTSQPWGEDSSPLVETLQSMVRTMKLKTEMTGPTAGAFKSLSLDERLSKLTRPLDDRTK